MQNNEILHWLSIIWLKKVKVPFKQQARGGFTLEAFGETWDCLCWCEVCGQDSLLVTHVQFCPKTELIFLFICVQVVRRRKLSAARIWQPLQLFISCQKGTTIFVIPLRPPCGIRLLLYRINPDRSTVWPSQHKSLNLFSLASVDSIGISERVTVPCTCRTYGHQILFARNGLALQKYAYLRVKRIYSISISGTIACVKRVSKIWWFFSPCMDFCHQYEWASVWWQGKFSVRNLDPDIKENWFQTNATLMWKTSTAISEVTEPFPSMSLRFSHHRPVWKASCCYHCLSFR